MPRQRRVALLVAGCFFMEMLDGTIVTTAAPSIGRSLGVPSTSISCGLCLTATIGALRLDRSAGDVLRRRGGGGAGLSTAVWPRAAGGGYSTEWRRRQARWDRRPTARRSTPCAPAVGAISSPSSTFHIRSGTSPTWRSAPLIAAARLPGPGRRRGRRLLPRRRGRCPLPRRAPRPPARHRPLGPRADRPRGRGAARGAGDRRGRLLRRLADADPADRLRRLHRPRLQPRGGSAAASTPTSGWRSPGLAFATFTGWWVNALGVHSVRRSVERSRRAVVGTASSWSPHSAGCRPRCGSCAGARSRSRESRILADGTVRELRPGGPDRAARRGAAGARDGGAAGGDRPARGAPLSEKRGRPPTLPAGPSNRAAHMRRLVVRSLQTLTSTKRCGNLSSAERSTRSVAVRRGVD